MNPAQPSVTGLLIYAAEDAPHFDCPVCMDHICKPDSKVLTSCGHLFCENCILRTQKSKPHLDCIKCPLCRMKLQKLVPRPVPLEKVPLHKIRTRVGWQQYRIQSIQRDIDAAPERILLYMQLIENLTQYATIGQAEIEKETAILAQLEAQIAKRQRTRRAADIGAVGGGGGGGGGGGPATPSGTPPATPRAAQEGEQVQRRHIGDLL